MIATGAVWARICSANTLDAELEPRPDSITSTRPVRIMPHCG
jgi:hypothetical protein